MSKSFKNTGGRYGAHSGSYKTKNLEVTGDIKARTMIGINLPGTVASSSFPFDTTANTEQAAALCKVYDASATTKYYNLAVSGTAAGYAANYQPFPGTEAIGDAIYFGYASKFGAMYMDMSATVGVYNADACTWEYWNGTAWGAMTVYDETDTTAQDGKRPFQASGYIILNVGDKWQTTDVDSQNAYWIRCRITAVEVTTTPLTNDKEHSVTTLTYGGTIVNNYGTIGRAKFRWKTNSGANNNTIFYLVNMSTGQSKAGTLTKAIVDIAVADYALDVNRGDSIAFFCSAEDATTEFADGFCELAINHS